MLREQPLAPAAPQQRLPCLPPCPVPPAGLLFQRWLAARRGDTKSTGAASAMPRLQALESGAIAELIRATQFTSCSFAWQPVGGACGD